MLNGSVTDSFTGQCIHGRNSVVKCGGHLRVKPIQLSGRWRSYVL